MFIMNDMVKSANKDTKTRVFIDPCNIVLSKNAEKCEVLKENPIQPTFSTDNTCILTDNGDGAFIVLDFGKELHGSLVFSVNGLISDDNLAHLHITFGESVSEAMSSVHGTKGATNDHSPRDFDINLGIYSQYETNQSGFRYAKLSLNKPGSTVYLNSVKAVLIYNDIPYTGSFTSSDERLNEIYQTAAYTAHLNLQDYLWDGIKRDRLVWIGDMHTEVKSLFNMFGTNNKSLDIIKKSLDYTRDITPAGKAMNNLISYSMWWVLIHSELYNYTADIVYLNEQKDYLSILVDVLISYVGDDGQEHVGAYPEVSPNPSRFLDWQTNDDENAKHCGLHGLLCLTLDKASELLFALGLSEKSAKAKHAAKLLKSNVPELISSKQAAALLALSGVMDPATADRFISATGKTGSTADGYSCFFGYYILTAKTLNGNISGAYNDMMEYWGGMLDMGATSFWEDFSLSWIKNTKKPVCPITRLPKKDEIDVHGDYGDYCYSGFRHSLCHGWSSGPVPFITETILGVKSASVGMTKVTFEPNLCGLDYIKGTIPTKNGIITVEAEKCGNSVKKNIILPDGVSLI